MNNKIIEQAIIEFAKSGEKKLEKSYTVKGNDGEYYTIKIEKNNEFALLDSVNKSGKFNTISALPSGNTCGCCNGSGRSN